MPAAGHALLARMENEPSAAYLAENYAPAILTTTGVFCFCSLIVVFMRLYARSYIVRVLGFDDAAIIITSVLGIAIWICFVGETHYAVGRHAAAITVPDREMFLRWQFAHDLFTLFGMMMVKVAVTLLLLRVVARRSYRVFLISTMAFIVIYTIVCAGTIIGACTPVSANWHLDQVATAKCISKDAWNGLGLANSVVSMVTDGVLALVPIPIIMKMQLNDRKRIALMIAVTSGFAAVVAGGIKTYYQRVYFSDPDVLFKDRYFVWAALELYIAIVAASLPTLRPLASTFFDKARTALSTIHLGQTTPNSPTEATDSIHKRRHSWVSAVSLKRLSRSSGFTKLSTHNDQLARLDTSISTLSKVYIPEEGSRGGQRNPSFELQTVCSRGSVAYSSSPTKSKPAATDWASFWGTTGPEVDTLDPGRIMVTTNVMTTSEPREERRPSYSRSLPAAYLCPEAGPVTSSPSPRSFFHRTRLIPHVVGGKKMIETVLSSRGSVSEPPTPDQECPSIYDVDSVGRSDDRKDSKI